MYISTYLSVYLTTYAMHLPAYLPTTYLPILLSIPFVSTIYPTLLSTAYTCIHSLICFRLPSQGRYCRHVCSTIMYIIFLGLSCPKTRIQKTKTWNVAICFENSGFLHHRTFVRGARGLRDAERCADQNVCFPVLLLAESLPIKTWLGGNLLQMQKTVFSLKKPYINPKPLAWTWSSWKKFDEKPRGRTYISHFQSVGLGVWIGREYGAFKGSFKGSLKVLWRILRRFRNAGASVIRIRA